MKLLKTPEHKIHHAVGIFVLTIILILVISAIIASFVMVSSSLAEDNSDLIAVIEKQTAAIERQTAAIERQVELTGYIHHALLDTNVYIWENTRMMKAIAILQDLETALPYSVPAVNDAIESIEKAIPYE